MAKGEKVTAILWLSNMKTKGKTRQRVLADKFQKGEAQRHHLTDAAKMQAAIEKLLHILQDCPMELDELHEMLKGIKVESRQFRITPKNPL